MTKRPITDELVRRRTATALSQAKEAFGLTTQDLAEALGKSKDAVDGYLAGANTISLTTFLRGIAELGDAFGNGPIGLTERRLCRGGAVEIDPDGMSERTADFLADLIKKKRHGLTPKETCDLADVAMHLIPELQALVSAAAKIRGE